MIYPSLALDGVTSVGHKSFFGVDFASTLSLVSPNGAIGTVSMDYLSPVLIRSGRLVGRKQNVVFDYVDNSATVSSAVGVKKHRFDSLQIQRYFPSLSTIRRAAFRQVGHFFNH